MKIKLTAQFASQAKDHACSKVQTCWCEVQKQNQTFEAYGEGGSWTVALADAARQLDKADLLRGKKRDKLFPATFTARIV